MRGERELWKMEVTGGGEGLKRGAKGRSVGEERCSRERKREGD